MTGSAFAALLGVWAAAIASPGPDLFQIIRVGAKDRVAGVMCALGIMVGNAIWIIASLLGLSALMQAVPQILAVLQVVGGGYLLYMGVGALRAGLETQRTRVQRTEAAAEVAVEATGRAHTAMAPAHALGIGVATNLSNPKAVLFFAAVFAQFIRPGMGWGWMVAIAATLIVTGLAWFVGFAMAVRALAKPIARYGYLIDLATGVLFCAIAVWMLWEGLTGLVSLA